jgi:hypothetical protein
LVFDEVIGSLKKIHAQVYGKDPDENHEKDTDEFAEYVPAQYCHNGSDTTL